MYKLLLCWRYLRTRFIALASVISVMLGVAIMILVNAVMSGFITEMQDRIHGVLSDVTFESVGLEGFADPEEKMAKIDAIAGEHIESMTPTIAMPAALCIKLHSTGETYTQPIQLIGIDIERHGSVCDFTKHLQHPDNREAPAFDLYDGGYITGEGDENTAYRPDMERAGWLHRRDMAFRREWEETQRRLYEADQRAQASVLDQPLADVSGELASRTADAHGPVGAQTSTVEASPAEAIARPANPFDGPSPMNVASEASGADVAAGEGVVIPNDPFAAQGEPKIFDASKETHHGAILGIGLVAHRSALEDEATGDKEYVEYLAAIPGDDVTICVPTVSSLHNFQPGFEDDTFTITDLYECKMAEYDASYVFVPLERLQQLCGMIDPSTGDRYVTQILIKVKPGHDINLVRDKLRSAFSPHEFTINTWRDKQQVLLSAVQVEIAILNVIMFAVFVVAGFGILAIFFMIVVEKTRDIGILKSLGASAAGIMQIFLGYGLALGLVGSGGGLILGLLAVHYINEIGDFISRCLGHEVFDPRVYNFYQIPAIVEWPTVAWIIFGALLIAVGAAILPALRAARMHPVRALRYE